MGTFRGLPPELLETLGLGPEGDEDELDEPSGPYEPAHRITEASPPEGVAGARDDPLGAARRGRCSRVNRRSGGAAPTADA